MHRRRISRTLGAAAGGLLGATLLPAAAAFADNYVVSPDPGSTETITGIYGTGFGGADEAPPAVAGSVQGYQVFDYTDTTTGATGTFTGDESTVTDGFADTNDEVFVTSSAGADAPPVGSVFDSYTFDQGIFTNVYSAIPTASGDKITDTLESALYGNFTIPIAFDAANVPAADAAGLALSDGTFVPQGALAVKSINGIPPLTMALQGTQTFKDISAGTGFHADVTTTTDGVGTYTEAVLVTSDSAGSTVGTAAGDVPGVGSVFNTMNLDGLQEVYSDIVTPSGNVITTTIVTPSGDFPIFTTYDATQVESPATLDLGNGDSIVATGPETLTGINGLPPVTVGVQGTDTFDLHNAAGATVGSFSGDDSSTMDLFDDTTQTILVTGNVAGDAPAAGSVIETVSLGPGFANVYSDIIGAGGAATISDTLITPFGDFPVPDAAQFALVLPDLTADLFSGA
jgi:hypothetical protein